MHRSRGIDRTKYMPTRYYETPTGKWPTRDTNLLRLLHNDFPFVIEKIAKISRDTKFIATSTNYGNNPYCCIHHSLSEKTPVRLFHLEQENLNEFHYALSVIHNLDAVKLTPVQVRFSLNNQSVIDTNNNELTAEAMVFTSPAIIWGGEFIGWEGYARQTYDCRHIVKLQFPNIDEKKPKFKRIRSEIQRLQRLWEDRDKYIDEVLSLAGSVGFAEYERLLVGVTNDSNNQFLVFSSFKGTAEDAANKLLADCPNIEVAFQITEGGGAGIIMGTPSDWSVLGPSSYRRGRVLCSLLIELKND